MARLIDADALIESGYEVTLDEVFPDWAEMPDHTKEAVCKHGQYLKKIISEQPTVDAVPVAHGRWQILARAVIDTIGKCTNCDGEAVWRTRNNPYAICPNCGAHMDLEVKDA